ncbi:MAG: YidC/Oxa1 family membrane protein insertase [Ignavibacteria bacterium]
MNNEAIYKEEKINPAGGCLPMLLQPILYALFGVFNSTIELRNREFFSGSRMFLHPDVILNLPFKIPIFGISRNLRSGTGNGYNNVYAAEDDNY